MTLYEFAAQIIRNILVGLPFPNGALMNATGWKMNPRYSYAFVTVGAFIECFQAIDANFDKQAFLDLCGLVEHPA